MIFDYAKQFYNQKEYPALAWSEAKWAAERPLEGVKILDASPVFRNCLLKYAALAAAGAELTIGISDVMPYDPAILQLLRGNGVPVVNATEDKPIAQDIILDCAGAFSKWSARYGVSELTRSGAYVYANAGVPVFLADEGKIKRIETCLGTGDGFIRGMAQLGYRELKGKRIVIFGSGKVGTGIIYRAAKSGAIVDVVTDPQTLSPFTKGFVGKCIDFRNPSDVAQVLEGAYAVVTATGIKGAVAGSLSVLLDKPNTAAINALINSGTLLVNMGVEDEFGDAFPESAALNGKRPLNFILEDPTQVKYIDATLALHNWGAICLIGQQYAAGILTPPAEIENAILDVTKENGLIADELELIYNI